MDDSTVGPVKGILNAYQRGAMLTRRICKLAQKRSATHSLDTIEPAQALEKSLEQSAGQIRDTYITIVRSIGDKFVEEIISDVAITNRLQALAINLQDHFMGLDTYVDEPEAFDVGSFSYIRLESERACKQAIHTLVMLEKSMIQAGLQKYSLRLNGNYLRSSHDMNNRSSLTPPMTANSDDSGNVQLSPRTIPTLQARRNAQRSAGQAYERAQDDNQTCDFTSSTLQYADLPTAGSYGMYKEAGPPPPPKSSAPRSVPTSTGHTWTMDESFPQSDVGHNPPPQYPFGHDGHTDRMEYGLSNVSLRNRADSRNGSANSSLHSPSVVSEMLKEGPTFVDREMATAALKRSADIIRKRKMDNELAKGREGGRDFAEQLRRHSTSSSRIAPSNSSIIGNIMDILQPPEKNVFAGYQHLEDYKMKNSSDIKHFQDTLNMTEVVRHIAELQIDTLQNRSAVKDVELIDVHPLLRTHYRSTTPTVPASENDSYSPTSIYSRNTNAEESLLRLDTGYSDLEVVISSNLPTTAHPRLAGTHIGIPSSSMPWIEDGIEVVNSDSGIMLASEDGRDVLPNPAAGSVVGGAIITQESSFYKYGGFCEGAKMIRLGQKKLKVQKKPAGLGFAAVVSMKCPKCTYEIGVQKYEADLALDRNATYTVKTSKGSVRFRQRFLTKSHLVAKHILDTAYACLFCVEQSKTVHGHDATIFHNATALLTHIQKHSRPLPSIPGITVFYASDAGNQNFDLCFNDKTPDPDPFSSMYSKLCDRPVAYAIASHHSHQKAFRATDPDGHKTLQFVTGARIIGITYPERHGGQWCCGYHDNVRAFFPTSMIQLEAPSADIPHPDPKSTLIATARWIYKSPSHLARTWLSFKAGEKISNINFITPDSWCWSGMNSRGKYGIFHSAFMRDLQDSEVSGGEEKAATRSIRIPHDNLSRPTTRSSGAQYEPHSCSLTTTRSNNEIFDGSHNSVVNSLPTSITFSPPPPLPRMLSTLSISSSTSSEDGGTHGVRNSDGSASLKGSHIARERIASSAASIVHPGRRVTESLRPVKRYGSFSSFLSVNTMDTMGVTGHGHSIEDSTSSSSSSVENKKNARGKSKVKEDGGGGGASTFPARFLGLGRSKTLVSRSSLGKVQKGSRSSAERSDEGEISMRLKMEGLL